MPEVVSRNYPAGLLEWAGHKSGGVRRLFDDGSGRPAGGVIDTPLLHRLQDWAVAFTARRQGTPRIVLLIGGPGNGKTEAVESTIRQLELSLNVGDELQNALRGMFNPTNGDTVPRLVTVDLAALSGEPDELILSLVQDASVSDPAFPDESAASLLVDDLEASLGGQSHHAFLACVNRGILDDALIHSIDTGRNEVRSLLELTVQAAGMSPDAPPCWPVRNHPDVAIWPMDIESLLISSISSEDVQTPAAQVLSIATNRDSWPALGSCPAGEKCPFCRSAHQLDGSPHGPSLLKILRWYELSTGKRWSFRDLFTLFSFMFAGSPDHGPRAGTPCQWAAKLMNLEDRDTAKPDLLRHASPFLLLASQYQHVLFGQWSNPVKGGIRAALRELKLEGHSTLLGLHYFLSGVRSVSVPATLRSQLVSLCDALDPALADPDEEVELSAKTTVRFRELDSRFSRSVREGLQFIRRFHCLSPLEVDVLTRLADAEDDLAGPDVRRRRPATSARLQMLLRDFSCRIVRRSVGARSAVVRNYSTVRDFQKVVNGDEQLIHTAVKQVEGLLNERDRFAVPLNTTFGQPLPPHNRRVILTTSKQRVRPSRATDEARPLSDVKFLSVGSEASNQPIPLTYELFRSVRELQRGMMPASLPRTVTALLDTTRARLAGRIVRDEDQLDGAEIHIGRQTDIIVRELGRFVVRNEGEDQ